MTSKSERALEKLTDKQLSVNDIVSEVSESGGLNLPDTYEEVPPPKFNQNYRKASCCSRWVFNYVWPMIKTVKDSKTGMSEDMLEDITLVDGETQIDLDNFMKNVKLYEKQWVDAGKPENGFYGVIKSALWTTFKWDILWSSFLSFISDVFAIGFTTFIIVLIKFIKEPDTNVWVGVGYSAVFGALMFAMGMCRNQ